MALDKLKEKMLRKAAGAFGIDIDGELPEVIASLNDAFDLGLDISESKGASAAETAAIEVAEIAAQSSSQNDGQSRVFRLTARPAGKPQVDALIVLRAPVEASSVKQRPAELVLQRADGGEVVIPAIQTYEE